MKYVFRHLPLFGVLFILSCNSNSKGKNQTEKENNINDYSAKIDSLLLTTNPRKFNGVILITENGETKYSKEYGYSDVEKKTPISLNDNFRIQSNSKQITAVLVLKEVEKGTLDLQNPIKEYLPDLEQTWADSVTVHQLLNMSSGIVSVQEPLIFEPGTDYKYSNPAYGLLGKIIEKVTGKKYIELASGLFKELGMNNSYCYEMGKANEGLINGYRVLDNEFSFVDFNNTGNTEESWKDFIPAGGIISNVNDLNFWDTKLHNGKVLKPETYKLMIINNNAGQHDAFGDEKIGYGYGVRIDTNNSVKIIGHGGRGLGFTSIKFYIPKTDVAVIVLENVYNEDESIIYHFENEIRKIVMNSSLSE